MSDNNFMESIFSFYLYGLNSGQPPLQAPSPSVAAPWPGREMSYEALLVFFHLQGCDKMPHKSNFRVKGLLWLTVPANSIGHHCWEVESGGM